jgi:hypothetical protein
MGCGAEPGGVEGVNDRSGVGIKIANAAMIGLRAERGSGYPAFFRVPDFRACFSGASFAGALASFAGAPPAIGKSISRWPGLPFAARLPLGAAAGLAAGAGGACLASVFGASSFALSML